MHSVPPSCARIAATQFNSFEPGDVGADIPSLVASCEPAMSAAPDLLSFAATSAASRGRFDDAQGDGHRS